MEKENKSPFLPSQEEGPASKTLETPAVKEAEEIEEKVKNVANLDDESLLIEDDGDFFWVLQRIIWGLFKTFVVLGGLVFLGWSIWGEEVALPKESESISPISYPVSEEKTKTTTRPMSSIKTEGSYIFEISQRAYDLENDRISRQSDLVVNAVLWLRKAKSLGEISMVVLRIQSPETRAKKIEETLVAVDVAFIESQTLQKTLRQQGGDALLKLEKENQTIDKINAQIASEIQRFQPQNLDMLLSQKIEAQQRASEYGSRGQLLKTLFLNIQSFDKLLRAQSLPMANPLTELKNQ